MLENKAIAVPTVPAVLLVASDGDCSTIQSAIEQAGAKVRRCPLRPSALVEAVESLPSAVVLDARSDVGRAVQLCRGLRAVEGTNAVHLVALTSAGSPEDRERLLEAGADDCWILPGDSLDLLQRVSGLTQAPDGRPSRVLRCGDVELDASRYTVTCSGRTAPLTAMQLKLLAHLMRSPGTVFSQQRLLEEVWGKPHGDERMVRACIVRLRRALDPGRGSSSLIKTVRGGGYAFDAGRARRASS